MIGRVCNDYEGYESTGKFKASKNSRKDVIPGAGRILKTPDLNRHTFLEEWQWEGGTSYSISGLEEAGSSFLLFLSTIVYKRNIDGRPLCKNCSSDMILSLPHFRPYLKLHSPLIYLNSQVSSFKTH